MSKITMWRRSMNTDDNLNAEKVGIMLDRFICVIKMKARTGGGGRGGGREGKTPVTTAGPEGR